MHNTNFKKNPNLHTIVLSVCVRVCVCGVCVCVCVVCECVCGVCVCVCVCLVPGLSSQLYHISNLCYSTGETNPMQ